MYKFMRLGYNKIALKAYCKITMGKATMMYLATNRGSVVK